MQLLGTADQRLPQSGCRRAEGRDTADKLNLIAPFLYQPRRIQRTGINGGISKGQPGHGYSLTQILYNAVCSLSVTCRQNLLILCHRHRQKQMLLALYSLHNGRRYLISCAVLPKTLCILLSTAFITPCKVHRKSHYGTLLRHLYGL